MGKLVNSNKEVLLKANAPEEQAKLSTYFVSGIVTALQMGYISLGDTILHIDTDEFPIPSEAFAIGWEHDFIVYSFQNNLYIAKIQQKRRVFNL